MRRIQVYIYRIFKKCVRSRVLFSIPQKWFVWGLDTSLEIQDEEFFFELLNKYPGVACVHSEHIEAELSEVDWQEISIEEQEKKKLDLCEKIKKIW